MNSEYKDIVIKIQLLLIFLLFVTLSKLFGDYTWLSDRIVEVYSSKKNAIVFVSGSHYENEGDPWLQSSTGFFIDKEGHVLTSLETIAKAKRIYIKVNVDTDSKQYYADLVGYHKLTKIALLKVTEPPENLSYIDVLDTNNSLRIGSSLITISHKETLPLAPRWSIFTGSSRYLQFIKNQEITVAPFDILRTGLNSFGGESGAPVFDIDGAFIGFNFHYEEAIRQNFILPQKLIVRVVEDLKVLGRVQIAWIGVIISGSKMPIRIKEIVPGSPSDCAGLKKGDIILELGGKKLNNLLEMGRIMLYTQVGTVLPVTVERNGKRAFFELKTVVDEQPIVP